MIAFVCGVALGGLEMVIWLTTAGAVIIVAVATALWWWGLISWLVPTAAAVVIAIAEVWWWVPRWQANSLRMQVRDAKARADLEDSFRKTIGQLFGGAAVLIGAGFAYYQSQLTQQTSHDQLISQQVSKGFEQLASDKLAMRLGGIYALEGVMNTSEQYHKPVLEALCAFVREGTKPQPQAIPAKPVQGKASKPSPGNSTLEPSPPPTDIQAALTVIGRRAHTTDAADLSGANLSGPRLDGANLSEADLLKANLSGAFLHGANLSKADLLEANLSKADLGEANLSGARLFMANLSKAALFNTNLREADVRAANLSNAHLGDADLREADLFTANLGGADLSGADLMDAKVSQDELNEACGDEKTKLPAGVTIKPCPPEAP